MAYKRAFKYLSLSSVALFLSACGSGEPITVPPLSSAPEIQSRIDPEIQGEERKVIADVMTRLDADQREYVSYVSGGKIYVNKLSLRNNLEIAKPLGNDLFQLSSGAIVSRPSDGSIIKGEISSQTTICPTTSGPFRKVATANGVASIQPGTTLQRFAYSRADIGAGGLLIGDSSPPILNKNPQVREVAYAYLGTSASMGVAEADVGVAYSPDFYTWAPTVLTGGQFITSKAPYDKPPLGPPTRFDWGYGLTMEFIVTANGEASITYTGTVSNSINQANPFTVVFPLAGVRKDGSKNIFKRVTAIAQAKAGSSVYVPNTGSSFSIAWTNVKLGLNRSGSGLHDWGNYANDVTNSCITSNSVQFGGIGGFDEEVFISN